MEKRGKNAAKLEAIMSQLIREIPLDAQSKDHKLQGKFAGHRECHIEPDWLLIYRVVTDEIIFERTGSHSDLLE